MGGARRGRASVGLESKVSDMQTLMGWAINGVLHIWWAINGILHMVVSRGFDAV